MRSPLVPFVIALAIISSGCSCEGEPKPAVEAEPPHATSPKPSKRYIDIIEPKPDEVPIPEDFEEQALNEVSEENLGAQLDAIEQEITADSQ